MLNDYTISFFDLEFEGLKFRRSKSFPEAEFNRLLDEDFPWSESRCIELSDAQTLEMIHISLSCWIICRLASFVVMGCALILVSVRLPLDFSFNCSYGSRSVPFQSPGQKKGNI